MWRPPRDIRGVGQLDTIVLSTFLFFFKSGEFCHRYVLPPFCYPPFRARALPTESSLWPEITFVFVLSDFRIVWVFIAGYSYPGRAVLLLFRGSVGKMNVWVHCFRHSSLVLLIRSLTIASPFETFPLIRLDADDLVLILALPSA